MSATLLTGDAATVLRTLPDGVVRCCVTSPPYWGLRDYGTAQWEGGDAGCSHTTVRRGHGDEKQSPSAGTSRDPIRGGGCRCGAHRIDAQLGLERTPEEYVAGMVAVFREVRRVLADDGTLWLNLGDSYNAAGRDGHGTRIGAKQGTNRASANGSDHNRPSDDALKPKDLVGIPWRVAFALQADGWYLRSDIIWAKPNPMPESVTDRPTKSHEYLFLLSKSERYYYDADAIAEPVVKGDAGSTFTKGKTGVNGQGRQQCAESRAKKQDGHSRRHAGFNERWDSSDGDNRPTRNARTVWTIATQPYAEAHFATFPEELARRCIVAGSAPTDTVLDPFSGSGTVAAVAVGNGRAAIGIELNPKYQDLARHRIGPMLCGDAA